MSDDVATRLVEDSRWTWREGMLDQRGVRVVDVDLWNPDNALPDMRDDATAGVIIGVLNETGLLTDIVRHEEEWIVAVDLPIEGLQGWAGATLGEAAGWALVATWRALGQQQGSA